MSGFVDFVLAKKTDAKAILKKLPIPANKWPTFEWKWCFRPEIASLLGVLRAWPKKTKLTDDAIEELESLVPEVGRAESDTVDEETSAMVGEKVYAVAGILWQLPTELIDLVAQTDEKDDLNIATAWHKYYDHWEPSELSELVRELRSFCQRAMKEKKCIFLLDNCAY
jgi:hypothetical protein